MLRALLLCLFLVGSTLRAGALPSYSRRYQTACTTCHTIAPALNRFGMAFQANYFRWPEGTPRPAATGLAAAPVSLIAAGSNLRGQQTRTTTTLRSFELVASEGGYLVAGFPASVPEAQQGSLKEAFVAVPMRGPWAILAGQTTPLLFQYDPINALTASLPHALTEGVGGFSPTDLVPTVRTDYFNHRGSSNPDGNYVSIGVPFAGALALREGARLGRSQGLYAHAFRRQGALSAGLLGFAKNGLSQVSALGTYQPNETTRLLAVSTLGSGPGHALRTASLEAEHQSGPGVALTGRLEWGAFSAYPIGAIHYFPPSLSALRFSVEVSGQKGHREVALISRIQL